MMEDSEARITGLLRSGDPAGLELAAAEYGDRLARAAFLICRDENEAIDIVQETFCRVPGAAINFRGDCRPYTWLYGIMRRVCFSNLRRARRWLHFKQQAPGRHQTGLQAENGDDLHEVLTAALERLPGQQAEIIVLRFFEEMKLAEIAVLLELPVGTVKSRLHHALAGLRLTLQENPNLVQTKKEARHALP